ncbi:RES family NAD+ phosphorylase [Alteriqipengyuania sp. 357]
MSVTVWRIGTDTKTYTADDLSGKGAEKDGGRWNHPGTPLVYASSTRSLSAFETVVHLNAGSLPLNRYLVEIEIPDYLWSKRETLELEDAPVGWDAEPASKTSMDHGDSWVKSRSGLLLCVPSVIVPEEHNVLLNPAHADMGKVSARKIRKWIYDTRLRNRET